MVKNNPTPKKFVACFDIPYRNIEYAETARVNVRMGLAYPTALHA